MTKQILFILIALLFSSCKKEGRGCPVFSNVYETVEVVFSDETTVFNHLDLDTGWKEANETTEYHYCPVKSSPKMIVVYARSKKYSYEHNPLLSDQMATHYSENLVRRMALRKTDFYKVYRIKIEDRVVFQNDEAISDTVWDEWLNDPSTSFIHFIVLSIEFNADYSIKSQEYITLE